MRGIKSPAVLTALFVAVLFALVFFRSHGWRLPSQVTDFFAHSARKAKTPEDTVYGMLDAARAGDTTEYVDTFAGPLRQQVEQVMRESGKPQFATYLATQSGAFQSVAVSVTEQPSDAEARLRVEYVYNNRNEVQTFHLKKDSGRWAIVGISGTDQIKTLIPFGTAVTDD
jgi:hypothetical protein